MAFILICMGLFVFLSEFPVLFIVFYKAQLFQKYESLLNARQIKVLLRIFDEGITGFKEGLSAPNYKAITGAPNATTTRDLQQLVALGILLKIGELKSTRYYLKSKD
jgi:Fic family protein